MTEPAPESPRAATREASAPQSPCSTTQSCTTSSLSMQRESGPCCPQLQKSPRTPKSQRSRKQIAFFKNKPNPLIVLCLKFTQNPSVYTMRCYICGTATQVVNWHPEPRVWQHLTQDARGSCQNYFCCPYLSIDEQGSGECSKGAIAGENSHLLTGMMHVRNRFSLVKVRVVSTQRVAKIFQIYSPSHMNRKKASSLAQV